MTTDNNTLREHDKNDFLKVTELLKEIGIPSNIKGYNYVREAILWCLEREDKVIKITKELYPAVATVFGTTASRVERAIRHAVEVSFDRGNIEMLNKIFKHSISFNRGKPTNSEAISTLVEYIELYL